MVTVLFQVYTSLKFWNHILQNSKLLRKDNSNHGGGGVYDFYEFIAYSFFCNFFKISAFFVNRETKFHRKSYRTQYSKRIFGKPIVRNPNGFNGFVLYIILSFIWIYNLSFRNIIRDSVHREVSPFQIVLNFFCKRDLVRSSFITIDTFDSIGCYFNNF